MKRGYPERPLVGVAGVVVRGQDVILVRRRNMPAKGEWSLPGGLVELGETVEEALHRELREELSTEVKLVGLVGVYDRIVKDRNNRIQYHYAIIDYCAQILSVSPQPDQMQTRQNNSSHPLGAKKSADKNSHLWMETTL